MRTLYALQQRLHPSVYMHTVQNTLPFVELFGDDEMILILQKTTKLQKRKKFNYETFQIVPFLPFKKQNYFS